MYRVIDRRGSEGKPTPEDIFNRLILDVLLCPTGPKPPGFFVRRLSFGEREILSGLKSDSPDIDVRCFQVKVATPIFR
jgi:hypothetical protein